MGILHRSAEHAINAISYVFVYKTTVLANNVRHGREIFVHECDEFSRARVFGYAGKTGEVRSI